MRRTLHKAHSWHGAQPLQLKAELEAQDARDNEDYKDDIAVCRCNMAAFHGIAFLV